MQRGEPWKFERLRTNAEKWSSPMGAVDRFYGAASVASEADAISSRSCSQMTESHWYASSVELLPRLLQSVDKVASFDGNDTS